MTYVQQGHIIILICVLLLLFKIRERDRQSFNNMMASTGHFSVVAAVMAECHVTTIHVLRGDLGIPNMIGLPNVTLNSMC